jgi:phage FluMu protein Com
MPITLNCSCGKTLRIADEHAGKRVKCPACNAVIASTPPAPQFEVVEDEPKQVRTSPRPVAKPAAKPRHDEDDDDTDSYGMKAAEKTADSPRTKPSFRRRADSDDDDDDRPRRRRRTSRRAGADAGADAGKRIGYIFGGVALFAIGGAVLYFAWENRIRGIVFGGILAIGGIVMVVQGLTGNIPDEE